MVKKHALEGGVTAAVEVPLPPYLVDEQCRGQWKLDQTVWDDGEKPFLPQHYSVDPTVRVEPTDTISQHRHIATRRALMPTCLNYSSNSFFFLPSQTT